MSKTGTRNNRARLACGLLAGAAVMLLLLTVFPGSSVGLAAPAGCPLDWIQGSPYPRAIQDQAMVTHNGVLYSFGGRNATTRMADSYRFDLNTNAWTQIASLPGARALAAAVSDGTYIYILGGVEGAGSVTGTLYRYDPVTNSYNDTPLASYTVPTFGHAAVYLNGKIYRIGGGTTINLVPTTDTVEIYIIADNRWVPARPIGAPGVQQAAALLMAITDGQYIYAAGGNTTAANVFSRMTYRYDPANNEWSDVEIADLPEARAAAASGVLNGKWIIAGGGTRVGPSTQSVISWDPQTNQWTNLAPLLTPRTRAGGAVLADGFSVIGGSTQAATDPTTAHQRYVDHVCPPPPPPCGETPQWQRGPYIPPASVDADYVPGVVAPDGNFYVGTGENISPNPVGISRGLLRFNPGTDSWQVLPAPTVATAAAAMGAPVPGYIYVATGWVGGAQRVTNALQIYDIANNSWTVDYDHPVPVTPGLEGAAYASFGGKMYLFGGDTGVISTTTVVSTTYIYDPAAGTADRWTRGPDLPAPRTWFSAAVAGDYIYLYGGYDGAANQARDTLWRYDPAVQGEGAWEVLDSSPLPIAYAGLSPYGEGKLLAAGGMNLIGTVNVTTSATWLYDIATGDWSAGPTLNLTRGAAAQGTLPDGRVIVQGGLYRYQVASANTVLGSTELLSPTAPCSTPTPTFTTSPTAAASPTPTYTPTDTPTNTPTSTSTSIPPTATPTPCLGQVPICHLLDRGTYLRISVDCRALTEHIAHGDIYPVPSGGCPAGPGRP